MDPLNPLERWQRDTFDKLDAEAYFDDIALYVLRPKEKGGAKAILSKLDQSLSGLIKKNGKAGAAIHILMPLCDIPNRDASGPKFDATMTIRVQELPIINGGADGTGKPVEEIALTTMHVLHRFLPGNGLAQQGFTKDAYTPSLEFDPKLTIDLQLGSRFGLAGPQRCAMPVIAGTAAAVQLSCVTIGAKVWYTRDHSFPSPKNPNAILYGTVLALESGEPFLSEDGLTFDVVNPFSVPPGTTIRAAAWKPDTHQGSDVAITTL